MKKWLMLLVFFAPFSAYSEPYQTASEDAPIVCKSGIAAYQAQLQSSAYDDVAANLLKSGECRKITNKTKFRVFEKTKTKDYYYYRIQLFETVESNEPQFISGFVNAPQDPEAALAAHQAELNKLPIGCTAPTGGQVNRLERGKDGQVYLERYMISTKCVNGQMRSFTKPID